LHPIIFDIAIHYTLILLPNIGALGGAAALNATYKLYCIEASVSFEFASDD
jgi:hypothetical protein